MKFSQLPEEVKFPIAQNAFGVEPSKLTETQVYELDQLNQDGLWQHACEMHDVHEDIYKVDMALPDMIYKLLQLYPLKGMNIDYMNILLQTGRKEELLTYLKKWETPPPSGGVRRRWAQFNHRGDEQ